MFYPPEGLSNTIKDLPECIKFGCGKDDYICPERGATFPADVCPDKLPDLSNHKNHLAEYLCANPDVCTLNTRISKPLKASILLNA